MIATGSTVGLPFTAVCIWMGWSLGNVKDRYLHYGLSSDAYIGQMLDTPSEIERRSLTLCEWTTNRVRARSSDRARQGGRSPVENRRKDRKL